MTERERERGRDFFVVFCEFVKNKKENETLENGTRV